MMDGRGMYISKRLLIDNRITIIAFDMYMMMVSTKIENLYF